MHGRTDRQSGQAIMEYILMVMIVVICWGVVYRTLRHSDIPDKLAKPIREDFARAYKYGHPQARGWDEGRPSKHVRIEESDNFRLYINPRPN